MSERKLILSMQMTFDGYVAGPNDEMDWMKSSKEEWKDMFKELNDADVYLLGRKMYPGYSAYWQSVLKNRDADANELKFAKMAQDVPHIVFTKGDIKPDWKNTRVAHDLPGEIVKLKKQPGKNIIAWGGAGFASSLLKSGLVNELRIVVNPVVLGKGKSLFDFVDRRIDLELIDSRKMEAGTIVLRYTVK